MALKDAFIAELKQEAISTKKMLERVPADKYSWRPHEKSMTIGRLAAHIAEIPIWVNRTVDADEYDFAKNIITPVIYENTIALLKVFEERQAAAVAALENATDEMLNMKYQLKRGEQVMVELPRKILIRNFVFSHIAHHRGQLSVYLRLLDLAVPGMYGPSADER